MIESIRIRNFQSLEDLTLDLGRFTALVGPSNSGKSAVRRALEAVATNAASTGRLRAGAKVMSVEILAAETEPLTWEKGTGRNAYMIEDPVTGNVLVQDKPGGTITPEAAAVLGLDDLNFAGQFDPPFLLTDSPSVVAKRLGELTNISVLFDAIREAARRRRQKAGEAKTIKEQADKTAASLADYADLPAEAERLTAAHAALTVAAEAHNAAQAAAASLQQAEQAEQALRWAEDTLARLPDLYAAGALLDDALKVVHEYEDVWLSAVRRAVDAETEIDSALQVLSSMPDLTAAEALVEAAVAAQIHADTIAADLALAEESAQKVTWAEDVRAANEHQEAEILAALAEIDTCPTCGQPANFTEEALCAS